MSPTETIASLLLSPRISAQLARPSVPESYPAWCPSLDNVLLDAGGIADYSFKHDGGFLGKGQFSSCQIALKKGREYCIKHTILYKQSPNIAARLLRESHLLTILPPHPNLCAIYETIHTPDHFYTIQECFAENYTTLEKYVTSHPDGKLDLDTAEVVLDQLIDAVRTVHGEAVCHRDIKADNILFNPTTKHVVLIDFGLATHFSRRQAVLSTVCGSPAMHAPEIVECSLKTLGEFYYQGPEIDAWCVGMTLLRCITGVKYPISHKHPSLHQMRMRLERTLEKYRPNEFNTLWCRLIPLLSMNGTQRLAYFQTCSLVDSHLSTRKRSKVEHKTTTFIPFQPRYSLALPVLPLSPFSTPAVSPSPSIEDLHEPSVAEKKFRAKPAPPSLSHSERHNTIYLANPDRESATRVISYIKYTLRSAGILYRICESSPSRLHCVMSLQEEESPSQARKALQAALLRPIAKRADSEPPIRRRVPQIITPENSRRKVRCLEFYIDVEVDEHLSSHSTRSSSTNLLSRNSSYANLSHLTPKRPNLRPHYSILTTNAEKKQSWRLNPSYVTLHISSTQASTAVRKALELGNSKTLDSLFGEERGRKTTLQETLLQFRSTLKRSISN